MKRNKRCNVKSGKWLYKQMTTIIQNQRHSKTNDTPNPISIQIQRPTITKCREDQSSPDCRLIRAFVAQPIKDTSVLHHLLLRKRERTGMQISQGGGLDPPGS